MPSRLRHAHLYGILDLGYVDRANARRMAKTMLTAGIDVLQLRAKGFESSDIRAMAKEICPLARQANVPFIINDHIDIAAAVNADGVHVGQDDEAPARAREVLGPEAIVGLSTHSLDQARRSINEPVDYIGFGPLFSTPTKPDYVPIGTGDIHAVHSEVPHPIFCIGGIKRENLPAVIAQGAQRVVIVSGILQAADISAYIRECRDLLTTTPTTA